MRIINYISFLILRGLWFSWRYVMPEKFSFAMTRRVGLLAYRLLGRYRRLTLSNLEYALGDCTTLEERERIARECFINIGYNFMELMFMDKIVEEWEERVEWEGDNLVDDLGKQGQGFFAFGGHLGCYTLVAVTEKRFKDIGLNMLMRPLRNEFLNDFIAMMAKNLDANIIYSRGTGDEIVNAAENGELIGLFMDQESRRKQGMFVKFFGRDACSHVVPGHLALKHDIPMLPLWMPRTTPGRFKVIFKEPLEVEHTGDPDQDLKLMTQAIVDEVEWAIRKWPEQWLWAHDRWKRKIDGSDVAERKKKKKAKWLRRKGVYLTSEQVAAKKKKEQAGDAEK